jgi:hypothetical protein
VPQKKKKKLSPKGSAFLPSAKKAAYNFGTIKKIKFGSADSLAQQGVLAY